MSGGEQRQRRTAVLNNSAYWLGQMDDGAASSKLLDDPDFFLSVANEWLICKCHVTIRGYILDYISDAWF